MLSKLKQIDTSIVYRNPYWTYRLDKYEMPSGNVGDYHYVDSRGATMVVPILDSGEIIMIRQYRYLNRKESLEFPGGGIKEGNTAERNAYEELLEETGYSAGELRKIGEYNPFNGVTNEICRIYLALDLTGQEKAPDESEEFEIIKVSEDQLINKIEQGEIWDGMTLAAWSQFYFRKQQLSRKK